MKDNPGQTASPLLVFLEGLPMFCDLDANSLRVLASAGRFRIFEKGEALFIQGDPSDFAYVVRSGKISIVINSLDGREMMINEMLPGDFFGELGILTGQARSTSAYARSKSELAILPRQAFLRILDDEPQVARRLLAIMAGRLQKSSERESSLAFLDAQARLAGLLIALDEAEQVNGYITISQEELANRTGLIRQTVAKALGKWRRNGWLLTGRGKIVLLNLSALKDLENKLLI